MYICNYCKRNFKQKFEICPACAGKSFSEKAYLGETIIKTPPVGGYTINDNFFQKKIKRTRLITTICIIATVILFINLFPFILISIFTGWDSIQGEQFFYDTGMSLLMMVLLIPFIILIITIIYSIKSRKEIRTERERIKRLANNGILVKGLSYELISDGSYINGKPLYFYIKVTYENANGVKIPIISKEKYTEKEKKDETVDLLIDPDDYSNYFIDFEIY